MKLLDRLEEYVFDNPILFFTLLLVGLFEAPAIAITLVLTYLLVRLIN